MSSLLAHLYTRIKGSPEDVATMSLCYILENSKSASKAFGSYLSSILGIESFPELFFRTQVAGENSERPDLVGFNSEFNELILCEAKFWAGLTDNQPLAYLQRLRNNEATAKKALVFICPNARVISLWGELLRLCNLNDVLVEGKIESRCTLVDGIHMAIVSWRSIIDILMETLSAEHSPLVGDLQQLQGLCESIDENAFIPFTPEDFGIDKARRIVSFYDIVDKVAAELINNMGATTKGLRATPQRAEYSRYLKLRDYGISVKFSSKHWINYEETPFWLTIRDDKWNFAKEAHEKLKVWENTFPKRLYEENKVLLIPLYAPAYECESNVVNKLFNSIKEVFQKLEDSLV